MNVLDRSLSLALQVSLATCMPSPYTEASAALCPIYELYLQHPYETSLNHESKPAILERTFRMPGAVQDHGLKRSD